MRWLSCLCWKQRCPRGALLPKGKEAPCPGREHLGWCWNPAYARFVLTDQLFFPWFTLGVTFLFPISLGKPLVLWYLSLPASSYLPFSWYIVFIHLFFQFLCSQGAYSLDGCQWQKQLLDEYRWSKWYTRKLEGVSKRCQLPLVNPRTPSKIVLLKKQVKGTLGREDREGIEKASGSGEHHRQRSWGSQVLFCVFPLDSAWLMISTQAPVIVGHPCSEDLSFLHYVMEALWINPLWNFQDLSLSWL